MITESELGRMFQAARRLEAKFPFLKEFQILSDAICPCYSGILDPVATAPYDERAATGPYDNKGSMLGCVMHELWKDTKKEVPTDFCVGLAQLDLDTVANMTGKDVGSGILQVWARERDGFIDPYGEHFIRVIPRDIVDRTKIPPDYSHKTETDEDYIVQQAELDELSETDPIKAEEEIYESHYSRGEYGFDWLLSSYYDYDSVPHEIPDLGAPLQIVGWEKAWYKRNVLLWDDIDFGIHSNYPQLLNDPDYHSVRAAFNRIYVNIGLFAEVGLDVESGWKALFYFDGPLSGVKIDHHLICYRTVDGKFQYSGTYALYRY